MRPRPEGTRLAAGRESRSLRAALAALALGALLAGGAARASGGEGPAGAQVAPAPPRDCALALAERVQARYDRMRDLEARFTQRTTSAVAPAQEASGTVVLAKPGKMRWSYERPEPSLVVSDGKTLWIFDPAAREVQEFEVAEQFLSGAALQFLLGSGRLLDTYRVRAAGCGEPRARLTLLPKADATYQELELEVDAASGEVHATAVVDLLGNRTEVSFAELRYDRGPAASPFRFEPEPGVRVLKLAPSS
jgi:outer membrane lipoprotein carrier protein